MFQIIKDSQVVQRHKTLSAARDALADIRKAALKAGNPSAYNGKDALSIGRRGESRIFENYNILEG